MNLVPNNNANAIWRKILSNNFQSNVTDKINEYIEIKPERADYTVFGTNKWQRYDMILDYNDNLVFNGTNTVPINKFMIKNV